MRPEACRLIVLISLCMSPVSAEDANIEQILVRLARLEAENAQLREEVRQLQRSAAPKAQAPEQPDVPQAVPIDERLSVAEARIEEQAATKVESAGRAGVRLKGMLLFNAFISGRNGAPNDFPTVAIASRGPAAIRGTMRQTSLGLDVESPVPVLGARAHGEIMADFYGTFEDYNTPRIRTGFLDLQWPSTALRVGIEKPIVAPRNPSSLAQFLYPALWGAGNLWLWQPQVRLEQKFVVAGTEMRVQAGILQTNEGRTVPVQSTLTLQPRPAWQGRIAFSRAAGETRAVELAPGFHYSRTLIQGTSVPSQLLTADWRFALSPQWELTGAFFTGRNAGGIGGLRQGIVSPVPGQFRAVGTTGGWNQLMYRPVPRLRFHAMLGQQDDVNRDLTRGSVAKNLSWIVNTIVQLSPNVLLGVEAQQIRSDYIAAPTRVLNRYDLALAYTF